MAMTAESLPPEVAPGATVFELERFEWASPDRLEIAGRWSGIRGRRFVRPSLVLFDGETERRRLLAVLDHKPWMADDGDEWIAAFPWKGDPVVFESAELSVAPGIDVPLPAPQTGTGRGKRKQPRFHRAVSRDATAEPEPTVALEAEAAVAPVAEPAAELERARVRIGELQRARDIALGARDKAVQERKALALELEGVRQSQEAQLREAREQERAAAAAALAEGADARAWLERERDSATAERDAAIRERDQALVRRIGPPR